MLTAEQLLIVKAELIGNTLGLGLTVDPADDAANADKLNEIRESIQLDRASIPANAIDLDVDEYAATSQAQRDYLRQIMGSGDVRPEVMRDDFYKIFGAGTKTRAAFEAVAKEAASGAQSLLGRDAYLTPSDISNARNAT